MDLPLAVAGEVSPSAWSDPGSYAQASWMIPNGLGTDTDKIREGSTNGHPHTGQQAPASTRRSYSARITARSSLNPRKASQTSRRSARSLALAPGRFRDLAMFQVLWRLTQAQDTPQGHATFTPPPQELPPVHVPRVGTPQEVVPDLPS